MNDAIITTKWGLGLLFLTEVLLIGVIATIGARTTLLRDPEPAQPDFRKRAFSLAKTQLAFWTIVVIGSFIYVYFAQGVCVGILNNTALLLLGISTGTTALSAVSRGPASAKADQPAAAPDHAPPVLHEAFLTDILSDNEGINIHRLQMVIWTVVFGSVFIHQVVTGGKFPTFDDQAYFLMGISSVTYVWFKRTEK